MQNSSAPGIHTQRQHADGSETNTTSLRYVDDSMPGITRRRQGDAYAYFDPNRKRIRDPSEIARINALAIPPGYHDVWICPDPSGHIQATGRDDRQRKQYRYHTEWQAMRQATKYAQLAEFGRALPRIRRTVQADLSARELTLRKMAAVVVRLLDTTLIRVGNQTYARQNKSFGLTTLRRRHVTLTQNSVRLRFRGKSGVEHDVTVNDRRIARVVRRCMEIDGQLLFRYVDASGQWRPVDSGAVNNYLRDVGGGSFSAKDFRTWAASVYALERLCCVHGDNERALTRAVAEVVREVAGLLGNTPAVCRACYIHPAIIEACLSGSLHKQRVGSSPRQLRASERRMLAFLNSLSGAQQQ